ncbi:hypothetical protein [Streptomyces sp. MP131-18]|uniref:hypothetical protein n=1 Tax=Streptomyces sp. MP131-18 TaxID=1857892 RepID=UPI00097C048A|nr:hypothetical protein [Streptomyces sp. MP131-18]ONK11022.1 hypothetical protein STBA_17500 [Streptomyces sp. MP131-18]
MNAGVLVSVEVDAATIARGDQIMIGGHTFTVTDMTAMRGGAKRLVFSSGESFVMTRTTVLWAARRHTPRRYRPRQPPRGTGPVPAQKGTPE